MHVTASLLFLVLSADGGTPAPPPLPGGAAELLPAGAAPDANLPLVIAIHGRGGNPERFGKLVQNAAAGARIVGLRAPDRWGEGYSWLEMSVSTGSYTPEMDRAFTALLQKRVSELRVAIAQVIKARPHCGDPILVGYSQGGALVLALAASTPADFHAQYFELAGALPASFPLGPNLPNLVGFQGTADQSVPYSEAVATFQRVPKTVTWTLYAYEGAGHDPPRELRKDLGDELRQAYQRACPKP